MESKEKFIIFLGVFSFFSIFVYAIITLNNNSDSNFENNNVVDNMTLSRKVQYAIRKDPAKVFGPIHKKNKIQKDKKYQANFKMALQRAQKFSMSHKDHLMVIDDLIPLSKKEIVENGISSSQIIYKKHNYYFVFKTVLKGKLPLRRIIINKHNGQTFIFPMRFNIKLRSSRDIDALLRDFPELYLNKDYKRVSRVILQATELNHIGDIWKRLGVHPLVQDVQLQLVSKSFVPN